MWDTLKYLSIGEGQTVLNRTKRKQNPKQGPLGEHSHQNNHYTTFTIIPGCLLFCIALVVVFMKVAQVTKTQSKSKFLRSLISFFFAFWRFEYFAKHSATELVQLCLTIRLACGRHLNKPLTISRQRIFWQHATTPRITPDSDSDEVSKRRTSFQLLHQTFFTINVSRYQRNFLHVLTIGAVCSSNNSSVTAALISDAP